MVLSPPYTLETALAPETRLDFIAADDVGAFAAAALDDTARFHGHSIDLAAEALTMEEVAATLSAATGRSIKARSFSEEEMLARGVSPGVVSSQVWQRLEGYQVDLAAARSWGVPLTSLEQWAADHRNTLTG